jgi:hypothetical protein
MMEQHATASGKKYPEFLRSREGLEILPGLNFRIADRIGPFLEIIVAAHGEAPAGSLDI